jgi:membrane protein DedA with SNARE-associated domain
MARLGGILIASGAIVGLSNNLGYLLPAIIGLESMGIPSPGETALVAAAILASQGKLQIWLVILIGVTSAIVGDNIGYWLGRRYGRSVFMAPGPFLHQRVHAIRYGDGFFKRHGAKAVFLGRWIALVRFATAWLAGINRMPIQRFFFWNALGAVTWGITYGLVGYFGGKAAAHVLAQAGLVGLGVMVLIFVGLAVALRRREQRVGDGSSSSSSSE